MNKPLTCEVEGDNLVISIGISTLSWAAKKCNGGVIPKNIHIIDERQWAKDVAIEIIKEDEIGNSMLNKMMDKAMDEAFNSGSAALNYTKI